MLRRHPLYDYKYQHEAPAQHLQSTYGRSNHFGERFALSEESMQHPYSELSISFLGNGNANANTPRMNPEHEYSIRRQVFDNDTANRTSEVLFQPYNSTISRNVPFQSSWVHNRLALPSNSTELAASDIPGMLPGSRSSAMTKESNSDCQFQEYGVWSRACINNSSAITHTMFPSDRDVIPGLFEASSFSFASDEAKQERLTLPSVTQSSHSSDFASCTVSPSSTRKGTKSLPLRPRMKSKRAQRVHGSKESRIDVHEKEKTHVPVPRGRRSRARRHSLSNVDLSSTEQSSKLQARHTHSLTERRYRENLNGKILQLHQTLRQAGFDTGTGDEITTTIQVQADGGEDRGNGRKTTFSSKFKKSDVLTEAINYVVAAELEIRHMNDEVCHLYTRIQALEKAGKCEDCKHVLVPKSR